MLLPRKYAIVVISGIKIALLAFFLHTLPIFADQASVRQPNTAVITITIAAQPGSRQDFRFTGDLGDFRLDDPRADDGDTIRQQITFTVTPGTYQVTEAVPATWHLYQIICEPAAQATIQLMQGRVTLAASADTQLGCTFTNQRGVTIRARSYHDTNGNRAYTSGERYLPDRTVTLYRTENILVGSQMTNLYGKAHFNYLLPGTYTLCSASQVPWTNSEPGLIDPAYAAPCYTVSLTAGTLTTLWFGEQLTSDPAPVPQPPDPSPIKVEAGPDVAADESGYDNWIFIDEDLLTDERPAMLFLPLSFVP